MATITNEDMLINANTDNVLISILHNFSTTYIIDVCRNSINNRLRLYNTPMPGLGAIEQNFKNLENNFNDYSQKETIMQIREDTYNTIISILCEYYNLTYTPDDDTNTYAVAYFLYDFLVSNFTNNLINFYVNYILSKKEEIYKNYTINMTKEELNNTSDYNKIIYNSPLLKYIYLNIATILDNISQEDIKLTDIMKYSNIDKNAFILLNNIIIENNNVFKDHFKIFLDNANTRSNLITIIKLQLHKYAVNDIDSIIPKFIKK